MSRHGGAAQETIQDMQRERAGEREALIEGINRKLRAGSGGPSSEIVVNVTSEAKNIVGFDEGDNVCIDVYRRKIVIRPEGSDAD